MQFVHWVDFTGEYCPATQDWHEVAGSLSWSVRPAVQFVQVVVPAPACWPAVHATQRVAELLSPSVRPAAQVEHTVTLASEYLPLAHVAQGVAALPSRSAVPFVHVVQALEPSAACWPATQFTQFTNVPATPECLPAGQSMQAELVVASWSYCPGTHLTHAVVLAAAYSPALQAAHDVEGSESVSALPAAQSVQALEPAPA